MEYLDYMRDVAEMLGVEVNKVFYLEPSNMNQKPIAARFRYIESTNRTYFEVLTTAARGSKWVDDKLRLISILDGTRKIVRVETTPYEKLQQRVIELEAELRKTKKRNSALARIIEEI